VACKGLTLNALRATVAVHPPTCAKATHTFVSDAELLQHYFDEYVSGHGWHTVASHCGAVSQHTRLSQLLGTFKHQLSISENMVWLDPLPYVPHVLSNVEHLLRQVATTPNGHPTQFLVKGPSFVTLEAMFVTA